MPAKSPFSETFSLHANMLHLMKLAVGVTDAAHLRTLQSARLALEGRLVHRTRSFPRRADEIRGGGSIYWVISGAMVVRQAVADIVEDALNDGSRCAAIVLDPTLISVEARLTRPFQGWRYLAAEGAPADITASAQAEGDAVMPEELRQKLRILGLL